MDINSREDKLVGETRGQSKYKKGGTAGIEGVIFQVNLLTVTLLNAFQNFEGWKLSTENKYYGKFDDVALKLPDGAILIQAKHRKNKKLRFNELFSVDSKNSDFCLGKYFFSYQEIKAQVQVKYVVICTNSEVKLEDGTFERFFYRERDTCNSVLYHSDGYSFYTFNDSILPKLEEHVRSYYIQNLKKKNADKGEEIITSENLSDFLNHLKLYCNYPSEGHLNGIIEQLFSHIKCASDLSSESACKYIHTKMLDWFRQPKGIHLEDCHVKAMIAEIRSHKYCKELERYNVFFNNAKLLFGDTKRILHFLSNDWYLLKVLKIYRAFQSSNKTRTDVLYVSSKDSVYIQHAVEAFELPQYTHLIIIRPEIEEIAEISKINLKLRGILHKKPYKKVILVSDSYNRLATEISINNDIYETAEEYILFKNLSTDTQFRLLKVKNINFQGKCISLEELFLNESLENCEKILDMETMEKLLKSKKVEVGSLIESLDEHTQRYYVHRTFIRKICSSGYEKDEKELIDEEKICDLDDKLILISDSPGAGKSTVFTHLAVTIKETMPHLWVLRINLNDYSKVFNEVPKSGMSEGNLLKSLIVIKLRNHFERNIFSMNQKVLLMLDGVDEICPDYMELVLRLIFQCQEASNIYKILITTRPHIAQELEEKLNVKALTLQSFTKENQILFLTNYWMHSFKTDKEKGTRCEHYARALVNKMASWMEYNNDDNNSFTAVPLQLRMLAEIFETTDKLQNPVVWNSCKQYLDGNEGEPVLPKEIYVAQLYEMFIIKKRDSFKHKGNPSGTIMADKALDNEFEESLDCHRSLALQEVLGNNNLCRCFSSYQSVTMTENVFKIGIIQQSCTEHLQNILLLKAYF